MVGTLTISPTDLGFDAGLLTAPDAPAPELSGLSIAVIPMPEGVRPETVDPANDPMDVKLQLTGALGAVLGLEPTGSPAFATMAPLPGRLRMAIPGTFVPPSVAALFATPTALEFDLSGAFGPPSRLYDVVVSLTFRVPILRVRTAINALR